MIELPLFVNIILLVLALGVVGYGIYRKVKSKKKS